MQGQRRPIDSFPETVDFDQGSVSDNTGTNQQTSWNNMLNPVENRLPSYMLSSGEPGFMSGNVSHDVQSFSVWGPGEPSSSVNGDGTKMDHAWSPSFPVHSGAGPRLEERFEPTSVLHCESGNVGSSGIVVTSGALFPHNSSSHNVPENVNRSTGYAGSNSNNGQGMGAFVCSSLGKSSGLEPEHIPSATFSSVNIGSSSGISGSGLGENAGGSASSLSSWGSSCKRKALEGTSRQYPGGSSSYFTQPENCEWHNVPGPSSLGMSTPPGNPPTANSTEQLNPGFGIGVEGETSDGFPPLRATRNDESSVRNFDGRLNSGYQQESFPFNLSRGSARHFNFFAPVQIPPSRSTAAGLGASQSQSNVMHNPAFSGNAHTFPWNEPSISRSGSSSNSMNLSRDRGLSSRDEANLAITPRNNAEHSMFVPANETRTLPQDPTSWSLAPGNTAALGFVPSTSRIGASSSMHPLPIPSWIPHHNPQTHNQQRLSGLAPWTLFPSVDSESGGQSPNFPPLSSGSSVSSHDTMTTSGPSGQGRRQAHPRSSFSIERQSDDVLGMPHSLRALAADIEGRHRLISEIRQVLGAMRRGENLRVEDYMLFDPLIFHGFPDIHDRHRDMRLDVDNMSYEELLALGERIGDVKTGLSEENILKLMKQQKYIFTLATKPRDMEPCCVCQEEYEVGDDLGTLDCGHGFHTDCIKQWLMLKNLCPICKTTGLIT